MLHSSQPTIPPPQVYDFTVKSQTQTFPNTEIFNNLRRDTNHTRVEPINMVNTANLFWVDNHINEVCNFAFSSLCRLRQATTGSSFCKNPCEIDHKPKKFHKVKNENHIQVVDPFNKR